MHILHEQVANDQAVATPGRGKIVPLFVLSLFRDDSKPKQLIPLILPLAFSCSSPSLH